MTKILFVCHGNICRSPMAEYVMKDLVRQSGREDEFVIASAATSREELGNPVYPPVRRKLAEHGIRCDGHAARQMTRKDYEEFGYLIGMDRMNLSNMARICGGDPEGKCSLLLAHAGQSGDVADPWYTGDFEATWQDVNIGCRALLKELTEKSKMKIASALGVKQAVKQVILRPEHCGLRVERRGSCVCMNDGDYIAVCLSLNLVEWHSQ